ncbi:MAG: hypothetical protein E7527_04740 [Ruminococcaceae bacterium]|nr:hypothetical protein [Oscillospiraceae bacterium]
MKKILRVVAPVLLAAAVVAVSFVGYKPRDVYDAAMTAMEQGDYEMARSHLERLEDNPEAQKLLGELYFVPSRVNTTYPDGTTELQSYAYNRKGCLVKAELTKNEIILSTTSYTYTEAGQMLTMDLVMGEETRPQTTVQNFYNELGHLTSSRTVGDENTFHQTTYTYGPEGRCSTAFCVQGDGSWERTEYVYDSEGQRTTEIITTDQGAKTIRHYGINERLHTVSINGKLTESYIYDQKGLLEQAVYADGRKITNTYNEIGQLTETLVVDATGEQQKTTLEYNGKGLLTKRVQETYKGVFTETFKYNKKALCVTYQRQSRYAPAYATGTERKDTTEKYTYTYDRHGNVEKETYTAPTGSYERTYKWKTRHYPQGMPQMIEDLVAEYQPKE